MSSRYNTGGYSTSRYGANPLSMNENIAQFPSVTLYDNELESAPSVADHTLLDLPTIVDPDSEDTRDVLEPTVVFFDTAGCEFYERTDADDESSKRSLGEGSKSNENEATVVAKWARKLVRDLQTHTVLGPRCTPYAPFPGRPLTWNR